MPARLDNSRPRPGMGCVLKGLTFVLGSVFGAGIVAPFARWLWRWFRWDPVNTIVIGGLLAGTLAVLHVSNKFKRSQ